MKDTTPLSDYKADVERFFDEQSSDLITNRDKDHAAVLISTLFKRAKKEIIVFTQHFDGEFYNRPEVSSNLLSAVEKGVSLKVLVQERNHHSDELFDQISAAKNGCKAMLKTCRPKSWAAQAQLNFTVVDQKAFRLEKDRGNCEALACANDPKFATELVDLFRSFEFDA